MKKTRFLNFFLIGSLSLTAASNAQVASTHEVLFRAAGHSQLEIFKSSTGERFLKKTVQDYEVFQSKETLTEKPFFLLNSTRELITSLDTNKITGTLALSVYGKNNFTRPLWKLSEEATEVRLHDSQPALVTGLGTCCSFTGYRLYDLLTGKLLLSYNNFGQKNSNPKPFSLKVPNSKLEPRYIGGLSLSSSRDRNFMPSSNGQEAALLITYAHSRHTQKIQIDMDVARGDGAWISGFELIKDPQLASNSAIGIQNGHAQLRNIEGTNKAEDIQGVALKITLDAGLGEKVIVIPVRKDRLDLDSTEIPLGITVRTLDK